MRATCRSGNRRSVDLADPLVFSPAQQIISQLLIPEPSIIQEYDTSHNGDAVPSVE